MTLPIQSNRPQMGIILLLERQLHILMAVMILPYTNWIQTATKSGSNITGVQVMTKPGQSNKLQTGVLS